PHLIVMENNDKQLIISRDICIQRAEQWQGIITAWSDARTVVYLMDADKLVYLDVKTLNPYRLNKGADILLGNSVDVNDSEIGDLRRHYCQQAIKSNQIVEYNYSHHWNDLDWNFVSRIVPVGSDNLIVTVSDPVGEEWQAQYFLKYQPSLSK
ncbi:MAG TPA: hypothetical protein VK184_27525, partial [Nostocaceae cyanobacterium]|nr:hypothetical protein [Nostocaceae cyanobacterium]